MTCKNLLPIRICLTLRIFATVGPYVGIFGETDSNELWNPAADGPRGIGEPFDFQLEVETFF